MLTGDPFFIHDIDGLGFPSIAQDKVTLLLSCSVVFFGAVVISD